MLWAPWPFPSLKPPPGIPVMVDRDHPWALGLMGAWLLNEGAGPPFDLVTGRPAILTSVDWGARARGQALSFNADADKALLGTDVAAWKPTSLGLVVLATWDGTNNAHAVIMSSVANSTGYELMLNTVTGVFWWAHTIVFDINNTSFTATPNIPFSVGLSYDQNGGTKAYANGLQVDTDATTGALTYSGTHHLTLGQRGDASNSAVLGERTLALLYNRPPSDTEHMHLHASPYAFLLVPAVLVPWLEAMGAGGVGASKLLLRLHEEGLFVGGHAA